MRYACDDGNTESGDGCSSTCLIETTVTVHWKIENGAGEPQPCPAGFDTVEVIPMTTRFTRPTSEGVPFDVTGTLVTDGG